ncbi:hypothetical protein GP486_004928 [Trichoglossum hirsutum]|uniref:NACHT domain-containing protein n=1 Tax=Trichoglossum hirsutum TaxID=265104 RepID=A0A9P8LAD1_9PEZI|nr:hypothetical protein GP486_004928 [Trichoglossum hirsutum]
MPDTTHENPCASGEWKRAIQSHLSRLDAQQRAGFEASVSAKDFADTFIAPSFGPKSHKATRVLTGLVQPLNRFGGVIDVLTQTNSGIGSPVWAPLKMACLICKERRDLIDKVHEFVERILSSADRIKSYEVVFEKEELVQNAIGMLYSDYVDFFTRVIVFAKRSLVRQLVVTFDHEFRQVTDALLAHEAAVDFAANAVNIAEAKTARASQIAFQQETDMQRRDLMRWISGPTAFDEDLRKLRSSRMDSGCFWFLQSKNRYIGDWLREPASSVPIPRDMIWVKGAPGTGKSVLASAVVDYLLQRHQGSAVPVLYFFCKDDHVEKRSSLPILRSLVSQLIAQQPQLSSRFEELYRQSGQAQVESFYALIPTFLNALADCPFSYIIIDAVDEGDRDSQNHFLEACSIWKSGSPFAKLRILITSRPAFTIGSETAMAPINSALMVNIDHCELRPSIELYVKETLEKSKLGQSLKSKAPGELDLVQSICACAQGNWLVATLALNSILKARSIAAVRRKLEALRCGEGPVELTHLYRNILLQLESNFEGDDDLDVAQTIWVWVIFSRLSRPLSVRELAVALTLRATIREEERSSLKWQKFVSVEENLFDPRSEILRLCSPLLEIDEHDFVHVVHYSVKEYFVGASTSAASTAISNQPSAPKPAVLIPEWQRITRLAFSSLRYMETGEVQDCFSSGQAAQIKSVEEFDISLPFFHQSLLPIWDFLGDYNYRLCRLLSSENIDDGKTPWLTSNLSKFHEFIYSNAFIPWIIGSTLLLGIHDVSVLVTRVGLMAALAEEELCRRRASGDIWELVLPHAKIRSWVEEFYVFARKQQWDFKFYETVALGRLWTDGEGLVEERQASEEERSPEARGVQPDVPVSGSQSGYLVLRTPRTALTTQADLSTLFHELEAQATRYPFVNHPLGYYQTNCLSAYSAYDPAALILPPANPAGANECDISATEIAAVASEYIKAFARRAPPVPSEWPQFNVKERTIGSSGKIEPKHRPLRDGVYCFDEQEPDRLLPNGTRLFEDPCLTREYERAKELFYAGTWDIVWSNIKTGEIYRTRKARGAARCEIVGQRREHLL